MENFGQRADLEISLSNSEGPDETAHGVPLHQDFIAKSGPEFIKHFRAQLN